MQQGFPRDLIALVRCPADGGRLEVASSLSDSFIVDGVVHCLKCRRDHRITAGILVLLDRGRLHPESAIEMQARDAKNGEILNGSREEWRSAAADEIEVRPTLEALGRIDDLNICELGCGPGRYTIALANRARAVLAVDLSRPGLLVLRRKLDARAPVALVQADVMRPFAARHAFARVLSTLHSNLPGRSGRQASLHEIAASLHATGRAVVSMHHHGLRDRLSGTPASGRYPDSGISRHYMTVRESHYEASMYFGTLAHIFIATSVPGIRSAAVSRAVSRLPWARRSLARLFLAVCEAPRAVPTHEELPCV